MLTKKLAQLDVATDCNYLTERFRLFQTYTVPSIQNQTSRNFKWVVLFSKRTPDIFKRQIDAIQNDFPQFIPVYLDSDENITVKLEPFVFQRGNVNISTRVDNDDSLSLNYVERVQKLYSELNKEEKYVLIFDDGYQFDEKTKYCNKYHFVTNHFSSLIIPSNNLEYDHILRYSHMEIEQSMKVIHIGSEFPMWLEVVHATNVSNRIHAKYNELIRERQALEVFGIDNMVVRRSKGMVYAVFSKPRNMLRLLRQYGIVRTCKKIMEKIKNE